MSIHYQIPEGDDLSWARDALFWWHHADSQGQSFMVSGADWQLEELRWLGLDWDEAPAPAAEKADSFAPIKNTEGRSLKALREAGYVREAVVATLAESSWNPPRGGRLLTRIELKLYFKLESVKTDPVFDPELLDEAQEFFMEELTPRELLQRTGLVAADDAEREELEGLALLFGEEVENLNEFVEQLRFYFEPPEVETSPDAEVVKLLQEVEKWTSTGLEKALETLEPEQLEGLQQRVIGRVEDSPSYIFALLGRQKVLARAMGENSTSGRRKFNYTRS